MTAVAEWFCDFCNPSRQRREVGDELSTGYARTPLDTTPPDGWFEVASGDDALPTGGHGCGRCRASASYLEGVMERVTENANMGAGKPSAWPSFKSPFDDEGEGAGEAGGVHGGK